MHDRDIALGTAAAICVSLVNLSAHLNAVGIVRTAGTSQAITGVKLRSGPIETSSEARRFN